MKRAYELTVLFSADLTSDKLKEAQDKIAGLVASNGGKVESASVWGRKMLSYNMNKRDEAVFVFFTVSLDPAKTSIFDQAVKHTEGVIRHLFVSATAKKS